jgi:hypothetical protein
LNKSFKIKVSLQVDAYVSENLNQALLTFPSHFTGVEMNTKNKTNKSKFNIILILLKFKPAMCSFS